MVIVKQCDLSERQVVNISGCVKNKRVGALAGKQAGTSSQVWDTLRSSGEAKSLQGEALLQEANTSGGLNFTGDFNECAPYLILRPNFWKIG